MHTGGRVPALILATVTALQPMICSAQNIGSAAAVKPQTEGVVRGETQPLAAGSAVYSNETVRTGENGIAELVFADSTKLSVGPTSVVHLDKFVYDPDKGSGKVVINATRGAYRFITGVQDPRSYEIKTPYATLGVRGTVIEANMAGVDCARPENRKRKACVAASPCGGAGYEEVRLVEGKFYATTKQGTRWVTEPTAVLIVCSNGTFAPLQFSTSSILDFTPLEVAVINPAALGLAAAIAAAAAAAGVAATSSQGQQQMMTPH